MSLLAVLFVAWVGLVATAIVVLQVVAQLSLPRRRRVYRPREDIRSYYMLTRGTPYPRLGK